MSEKSQFVVESHFVCVIAAIIVDLFEMASRFSGLEFRKQFPPFSSATLTLNSKITRSIWEAQQFSFVLTVQTEAVTVTVAVHH